MQRRGIACNPDQIGFDHATSSSLSQSYSATRTRSMPSYSLVAKSGLCLALLLTLSSVSLAQAPAVVVPPQLQFMEGHTAPVYAVATSPDGTTLLSASIDGTIRAWDRASSQPIRL